MKNKIIIFGLAAMIAFTIVPLRVVHAKEEVVVEEIDSVDELIVEEPIELSLEKAVEYALENSLDMKVIRSALDVAEIVYEDDIRGIRDIERNPGVLYERVPESGFMRVDDASVQKRLVENGSMRRGVEFTFNRAQWDVEAKQNQVKYNVEKAYFDLLQMEKEQEIARENLELAQKQYDHGKLRFDLGMISQQQLLGLEFNLSQAQSGYDSAMMYNEMQRMSFRNTLGMPFGEEFALTDSIQLREYDEIDLEGSIKSALEENLAVIMSKENYELTQLMLEAVAVKYPDITYRYRTQAAEVVKAEQSYIQTKNGIEMMVRSSVLNLETAEKQIATFEKAVYQASEGVRIAELSFELGQNTATEVAQANLNLMNAKKNLAQQIHAFNMALLDYKYSIGIGKGF